MMKNHGVSEIDERDTARGRNRDDRGRQNIRYVVGCEDLLTHVDKLLLGIDIMNAFIKK